MSIEITCPKCSKRLRAPETHVGKKTRCPQCQEVFVVTAEGAPAAPTSTKRAGRSKSGETAAPQWTVQIGDGSQFGPIPKSEVDAWVAEGRIDSQCQLLQEGWEQWKWADEVYPQLATGEQPAASAPPPVEESEFGNFAAVPQAGGFAPSAAPGEVNPYAGPGKRTKKGGMAFAGEGIAEPHEMPATAPVEKRSQSWICCYVGSSITFFALIAEGVSIMLFKLITQAVQASQPKTVEEAMNAAPPSVTGTALLGTIIMMVGYAIIASVAIIATGWVVNLQGPEETKSKHWLKAALGSVGASVVLILMMVVVIGSMSSPPSQKEREAQSKRFQERISKAKDPAKETAKIQDELMGKVKSIVTVVKIFIWAIITAAIASLALYAMYLGEMAKFFHNRAIAQQCLIYAGFIGFISLIILIGMFAADVDPSQGGSGSTGQILAELAVFGTLIGACGWLAYLTMEVRKMTKRMFSSPKTAHLAHAEAPTFAG